MQADAKVGNFEHILSDKKRVFNLDESAFFFAPDKNKVLAEKNAKHVYNTIMTGEKENLTVLLTINAAGDLAPPLVIFPLKNVSKDIAKNANRSWALAVSERGWITSEIFFEYIANTFLTWLKENNFVFPIILYCDGHTSHLKYWVAKFCQENQIIVIVLYPNSTHMIQPLDVGIFKPLKSEWKKKVLSLKQKEQPVKVTNKNFCGYFEDTLDVVLAPKLEEKDRPDIAEKAFGKSGLCPFDADAVDYNKLTKKTKKSLSDSNTDETINAPVVQSNATLLDGIELQLEPEVLDQFRKNTSHIWYGDVQYAKLFELWKKLQPPLSASESIDNSSSLTQFPLSAPESIDNSSSLTQSPLPAPESMDNSSSLTRLSNTGHPT